MSFLPSAAVVNLANISRDMAERLILASDYNEKSTILLRITMLALFDSLALWAEFIKFPYSYKCQAEKDNIA